MRSAALRVSYRQGSTVIRRALELTGGARLGMRVGAVQHPTAWGLLGFALMSSDTLQHAIETGVRYQNLSGAMVMWSAEQEDEGLVLRAGQGDHRGQAFFDQEDRDTRLQAGIRKVGSSSGLR